MDALKLANEIRLRRAEIKRDLHSGKIDIRGLILNPPEEILNMTFYEMFTAQKRWGRDRTLRLFNRVRLSETLKFGALSQERRQQLVDNINGR
jgi:hypothetical protein